MTTNDNRNPRDYLDRRYQYRQYPYVNYYTYPINYPVVYQDQPQYHYEYDANGNLIAINPVTGANTPATKVTPALNMTVVYVIVGLILLFLLIALMTRSNGRRY